MRLCLILEATRPYVKNQPVENPLCYLLRANLRQMWCVFVLDTFQINPFIGFFDFETYYCLHNWSSLSVQAR